jgi:hypothetical protein
MSRAALLIAICALYTAPASAAAPLRIALVVHMVERDGQAVAPPSFVEEQVARANEIFVPLGFELVVRASKPLAVRHAELVSRADRDALARYVRPGAIHCFIVAKLMDVDEPGRERRGVHWHTRSGSPRHFVVVSKISGPYVLAHELGHFFGNPQHSDVAGNLMSYERAEVAPYLDAQQSARVRAALTRMLETRELVAEGASRRERATR